MVPDKQAPGLYPTLTRGQRLPWSTGFHTIGFFTGPIQQLRRGPIVDSFHGLRIPQQSGIPFGYIIAPKQLEFWDIFQHRQVLHPDGMDVDRTDRLGKPKFRSTHRNLESHSALISDMSVGH